MSVLIYPRHRQRGKSRRCSKFYDLMNTWQRTQDSNLQPRVPKTLALPIVLILCVKCPRAKSMRKKSPGHTINYRLSFSAYYGCTLATLIISTKLSRALTEGEYLLIKVLFRSSCRLRNNTEFLSDYNLYS